MVVPIFELENRSGQWRTNLVPPKAVALARHMMGMLAFHPRPKRLGVGECCVVTLALPFDDLGWRARFWYLDTRHPMDEAAHQLFMRIGWAKQEAMQLIASTDWTDR
jgi:hypothetical protein